MYKGGRTNCSTKKRIQKPSRLTDAAELSGRQSREHLNRDAPCNGVPFLGKNGKVLTPRILCPSWREAFARKVVCPWALGRLRPVIVRISKRKTSVYYKSLFEYINIYKEPACAGASPAPSRRTVRTVAFFPLALRGKTTAYDGHPLLEASHYVPSLGITSVGGLFPQKRRSIRVRSIRRPGEA